MQSRAADAPVSTVTNKGSQQQLVTANLVQLSQNCDARAIDDPLRTVRAGGQHHGLVTAFLSRQFGNSVGQAADQPAPTVTAGGGGKSALVECVLSPELEAGALRCAAFRSPQEEQGIQPRQQLVRLSPTLITPPPALTACIAKLGIAHREREGAHLQLIDL